MKGILGKKIGMMQIFDKSGAAVPVTVIQAGPCFVIQVKTKEKDGYDAIQVGFSDIKKHKLPKPQLKRFELANVTPKRFIAEIKGKFDFKVGDCVKVDIFKDVKKVDVTGVSKGKGFAGVTKRWGFARGRMSHGSKFHRAPGSIGNCSFPGEVFKGKKMPGHYGAKKVTVLGLKVEKIDSENNLIFVRGAVPGSRNNLLKIRESVKGA